MILPFRRCWFRMTCALKVRRELHWEWVTSQWYWKSFFVALSPLQHGQWMPFFPAQPAKNLLKTLVNVSILCICDSEEDKDSAEMRPGLPRVGSQVGHTYQLKMCLTLAKHVLPTFSFKGTVAEGAKLRSPASATDLRLWILRFQTKAYSFSSTHRQSLQKARRLQKLGAVYCERN